MKKIIALMTIAALALLGCTKEMPVQEDGASQALTFNLTVTHPDGAGTKAVKTGWEDGDVVFVFFSGAAAPRYLEMKYDGENEVWTQTPKNGTEEESFALSGSSGTMTAVYLPFGSDAAVEADGTKFKFSKTCYSYYFVAEKADYEVVDGEVKGTLAMVLPEGFVQFYMWESDESVAHSDGAYTLGIDAVIPVGVASISADGTVTETSNKAAKDDLPGYAYGSGYVFSGKLVSDYQEKYGNNYYFARTRVSNSYRWDYVVSGKTLASHDAVVLPKSTSADWQWVGATYRIVYRDDSGIIERYWPDCNFDCTRPEQVKLYTLKQLSKVTIPANYRIPTANDIRFLVNYCSWTWLTIHGRTGMVIRSKSDTNGTGFFIFLPSYVKTHDVDPDDDPLAAGLSWKNTYWGEEDEGFVDGFARFNLLYFTQNEHKLKLEEEDPEGIFERVYAFALRLCLDD